VEGSIVVLALLGCTKEMSSEEKAKASSAEFEKRKPALEAQVKAIQALAAVRLPKPEEKIASPGVPLVNRQATKGKNLILVPIERLADLTAPRTDAVFFLDVDLERVPQWLKGTEKLGAARPDWVASTLDTFTSLKFVLILKTTRYDAPVLGTDKSGKPGYLPGAAAGEAHLYGIDGKRYGGVSFSATSSASVTIRTKGEDRAWVEGDLKNNTHRAMETALTKHLPDTNF
jgi:hypothetical protein